MPDPVLSAAGKLRVAFKNAADDETINRLRAEMHAQRAISLIRKTSCIPFPEDLVSEIADAARGSA